MAGIGDLFGSLGLGGIGGGGIVNLIIYMVLGLVGIGVVFLIFFMMYRSKKKWFLTVEVKIPRSDGRIMMSESARGTYDAKKGVVLIKRTGKKPVPLKPFDIKRFLQGGRRSDTLTVVQVGIEDYRPVLIESYLDMIDDQTGEEAALMNIKIDTTESKSWKESFEREAKNAYSLQSLIQQYASYIGFGILFFSIFVGFAILWSKVK